MPYVAIWHFYNVSSNHVHLTCILPDFHIRRWRGWWWANMALVFAMCFVLLALVCPWPLLFSWLSRICSGAHGLQKLLLRAVHTKNNHYNKNYKNNYVRATLMINRIVQTVAPSEHCELQNPSNWGKLILMTCYCHTLSREKNKDNP